MGEDDNGRLYGVVTGRSGVRVVSIPIERETEKLIYFRHGGEVFPGRETVNKRRDRKSIFRSARAALDAFVAERRESITRYRAHIERCDADIEAATTLADELAE